MVFIDPILEIAPSFTHNGFISLFLSQENILLRQRGQSAIKVIDFGSSCYEHQKGNLFNNVFFFLAH